MNTKTPHRLGRYQLLERIAVGGMAEVYKAVSQGISGFEKTVVVKRLLPQHQRDQELLTMFVDEARLLGRMRHPNIAEVYDIDHDGDEYFFALEYVDGVDLRVLLDEHEKRPLPLEEALWITVELARALAYVHAVADDSGRPLQIVHRDISPSNVIVDHKGAVKLVDFGVAKWLSQRSETRHGVLKGKVSYMSPEQCRGEPVDHQSDIFALGVLLYEMTVGERPFAAPSDFETLKAIAEGQHIRPSERLNAYPPALEAIVEATLALRREDRPANMPEVVNRLLRFAEDSALGLAPSGLSVRAQRICALRTRSRPSEPVADGGNTSAVTSGERTATMAAVPWVNLGASSRAEPSRAHSLFSGGEASTNTEARAHAQVSVGRPTSGGATTLPDVPVARGRWLWAATLVVTLVAGGGLWLSRASHDVQDLSLMKRRPLDATSAPAAIHMSLTTPAPVAAPALGAPTVGGSKENFPGPLPGVHPPTKPVVSARGQRKRSAVGEHSPPQKPSTFVKRGTATPSVWDPDSPVPP